VNFLEPQPYEGKNLMEFPELLQGSYISSADSMFLTIYPSKIVLQVDRVQMLPRKILNEPGVKVAHDSLWVDAIGVWAYCKSVNDSLRVSWQVKEPFFVISDSMKLRKMSNDYFLNMRNNNQTWRVINMRSGRKGRLIFKEINKPDKIDKIRDITQVKEVVGDSGKVLEYRLNPSKEQLKMILKAGAFTTIYQFGKLH
jgi:hypothetical protein